ncbi:MAG: hypothetical protein CSA55_02775 [Ilumatobacter coccineus]|uniref:UPF0235 protein CSA55_02775 n=1 Tax=Ilumatobacter coccineus TaxID=467094 RepID=A0A2G6KAW9_9ACTN|nr:MAG: hypothetical protein CSA55_02775 [Ilumatobacter coccineus]
MGKIVIRVQPGARRSGFVGWYGDLPKLAVAAPPVDGAANAEVVSAVASALDIRPRRVRIVGGESSRTKRLEVDDLGSDELNQTITQLIDRRG